MVDKSQGIRINLSIPIQYSNVGFHHFFKTKRKRKKRDMLSQESSVASGLVTYLSKKLIKKVKAQHSSQDMLNPINPSKRWARPRRRR